MAVSLRSKLRGGLARATGQDRKILEQMTPLFEDLWRMQRYLSDLELVWPSLSPEQREEIESSRTHRERFHENRAERQATELLALAKQIRSVRHARLRATILRCLKDRKKQEPDMIKVVLSMINGQNGS